MSEYIFFVGDDYECSNKEYVVLPTDKGQQITVALTASGVPFKGSFDKNSFVFDYDGDYKESVDEIIENYTSEKCADIRREVEEHRRDKDYGLSSCNLTFSLPLAVRMVSTKRKGAALWEIT